MTIESSCNRVPRLLSGPLSLSLSLSLSLTHTRTHTLTHTLTHTHARAHTHTHSNSRHADTAQDTESSQDSTQHANPIRAQHLFHSASAYSDVSSQDALTLLNFDAAHSDEEATRPFFPSVGDRQALDTRDIREIMMEEQGYDVTYASGEALLSEGSALASLFGPDVHHHRMDGGVAYGEDDEFVAGREDYEFVDGGEEYRFQARRERGAYAYGEENKFVAGGEEYANEVQRERAGVFQGLQHQGFVARPFSVDSQGTAGGQRMTPEEHHAITPQEHHAITPEEPSLKRPHLRVEQWVSSALDVGVGTARYAPVVPCMHVCVYAYTYVCMYV